MANTEYEEHLEIKISKPKKYNVIFYNDNKTTMDFVVYVLCKIYEKSEEEATRIMLNIHNNNKSVVGTYSKDGAYTRACDTLELAKSNNFPLKVEVKEV